MTAGPETPQSDSLSLQEYAASLLAGDAAAGALGITLGDVAPGHAVLTMTVTPAMVNGLDICHGGIIFTLADTAMAIASNTCRSQTVAASAAIEFLAPARVGDVLTASCAERIKPARSALNDSSVVNQDGVTIAEFRGRTVTIGDR